MSGIVRATLSRGIRMSESLEVREGALVEGGRDAPEALEGRREQSDTGVAKVLVVSEVESLEVRQRLAIDDGLEKRLESLSP